MKDANVLVAYVGFLSVPPRKRKSVRGHTEKQVFVLDTPQEEIRAAMRLDFADATVGHSKVENVDLVIAPGVQRDGMLTVAVTGPGIYRGVLL